MKGTVVMLGPFGIPDPAAVKNGFRGHKGTSYLRLLPMASALKDRGWDVEVILPPVHEHSIQSSHLEYAGVDVENLPIGTAVTPADHLRIASLMLSSALEKRPDVIHIFKPKGHPGLAAMMLQPARRIGRIGIPIVVDADDLEGYGGWNERMPYSGVEQFFYDIQENYLLRRADGITVASRYLADYIESLGREAVYVPNGPFKERYSIDEDVLDSVVGRYGLSDELRYVMLYTQFKEFRWEDAALIYEKILAEDPGAGALIVGAGMNREEEKLARRLKKSYPDRVVATGFVPQEDALGLAKHSSVGIFIYDDTPVNRAKCSVRLIDLMVMGIPVVASPVGELQNYIEDGENGYLADMADMATKVLDLLNDDEKRYRMSRRAVEIIEKRFSWKHLSRDVENLYKNVLGRE